MTTDIGDLIRLVRENPDLRDSLRKELLTQELIDLPEKLAALTEKVESLSETIGRLAETLEGDSRRIRRLSDDFGVFRGNFAERAAVRNAAGLVADLDEAQELGLDEGTITILSREQIQEAARCSGDGLLGSFPRSQRISLYDADLVIRVLRRDGGDVYVVVQTSYTCDTRDTVRALDNAALLEATTGKPALPVVAGARVDRQIMGALSRGDVHWYRLFDGDMEPDEPR